MRSILTIEHALPWLEGIITALTTRIRAMDVAAWTVDDVMTMIHTVGRANFGTRELPSIMKALARLVEQLSGQFSAAQLVQALGVLQHAAHSRLYSQLPVALAEELLHKPDWRSEEHTSELQYLLRI